MKDYADEKKIAAIQNQVPNSSKIHMKFKGNCIQLEFNEKTVWETRKGNQESSVKGI